MLHAMASFKHRFSLASYVYCVCVCTSTCVQIKVLLSRLWLVESCQFWPCLWGTEGLSHGWPQNWWPNSPKSVSQDKRAGLPPDQCTSVQLCIHSLTSIHSFCLLPAVVRKGFGDAGLVTALLSVLTSPDQELLLHAARAISRISYDNCEQTPPIMNWSSILCCRLFSSPSGSVRFKPIIWVHFSL